MPKPRQLRKENEKKSSKHAVQGPQTADDYLAAGVDLEEAGEKWRAGDAAKSTRFFVRAIDTYSEGLTKFRDSFDLAYNKARVQYEVTQHPRLTAQLPETLLDLLSRALESSRFALNLGQDSPDVLFNTAQVLTSLAEALEERRSGTESKEDSLRLLEEAIDLFQRCLTLQEYHYAESQAQEEAAAAALNSQSFEMPDASALSSTAEFSRSALHGTDGSEVPMSQHPEEEQWATIVEPVTNDTLLDTVLAQLETLTTLCEIITADEGRGLAWIEEYASELLNNKIPNYIHNTDREDEAAFTRANFIATLAEANFRSQRIDAATYSRAVSEAFGPPLNLSRDPEGLSDKAQALIAYSSSLGSADPTSASAQERWGACTAALEALTQASTVSTTDHLARIHLMRGDVELLRYGLAERPTSYPVAQRNGTTLLKNAVTYYRGAEGHARVSGLDDEVMEAAVKQALAAALSGAGDRLRDMLSAEEKEWREAQRVLAECVDAGLVGMEWLLKRGLVPLLR